MRHFLSRLCLCLFIVGCQAQPAGNSTSQVAPAEVLNRAAQASTQLDSASFTLNANYDAKDGDNWLITGTANFDGLLANGGEQVRFRMSANAVMRDQISGDSTVNGTVEVVVAAPDEVYTNLQSLTVQPEGGFMSAEMIAAMANKWWLLPPGDSMTQTTEVTPDPSILQAQSQVVSVTNDRGIVTVNGVQAHHYDVEIDADKMVSYLSMIASEQGEEFDEAEARAFVADLNARGQLWIGTENYYLHRMQWVIEDMPLEPNGTIAASFTADIRDHNAAPDIILPENATLFSPLYLLGPALNNSLDNAVLDQDFVESEAEFQTIIEQLQAQ